MQWMLLVLFYGVSKGVREVLKKKAMTVNSMMDVLIFYTFLSFLMVVPTAPKAFGMETKFYFYIALKSLCIFVAWIFSFKAIAKLPMSLYGVLDLSRVLFSTFMGIIFLQEALSGHQMIGLLLVSTGLLLLRYRPAFLNKLFLAADKRIYKDLPLSNDNVNVPGENIKAEAKAEKQTAVKTTIYVLMAFVSCLLNGVSGTMDKVLMKDLTSTQLQFWYMLFLMIYYILYLLITRTKINKSVFKNGWVWALAVLFVVADRALFIANADPASKVTIMTLIKQSGAIVTILAGKYIFKERNISDKLFCAVMIIIGIAIGVM
ncbi:MAG: EamA family transporter [Lachnospiraceae bacterium]|nr:EamA family transporter [Lachnospiraceae bacterium]